MTRRTRAQTDGVPDLGTVPDIDRRLEGELAALADGSLDPARAAALEAQAARSTELSHALAEQRRALSVLAAAQSVTAPESLHRQLGALTERRRPVLSRLLTLPPAKRASAWATAGVAGAIAAAVAIVVAVLAGGGETAAARMHAYLKVASASATAPAPHESMVHRAQLAVAVDGVPFPYWEDRFGWRAMGTRSDRVAGRAVTTVLYADQGQRVAYSIVAGPAPAVAGLSPLASHPVWRGGLPYTVGSAAGRTVVTWVRSGHRCVLSAEHIPASRLLLLASWRDGSTAS